MTSLSHIRSLYKDSRLAEAEQLLGALIAAQFGLHINRVHIRKDGYSLNSVNGFVTTDEGRFFFKFHQEEDEEKGVEEYYRADILAKAGFPVDLPVHVSTEVGKQILLYHERSWPRFADICKEAEITKDQALQQQLIDAQQQLDQEVAARYLDTLHPISTDQIRKEPVLQLFYWRLVEKEGAAALGGRAKGFYHGKQTVFPGLELAFDALAMTPWRINGVRYRQTLNEIFHDCLKLLSPEALAGQPGLISHGDAHNANLWYVAEEAPRLRYFDPAFAGEHIPALLAEIKPTFHNIFAHPLWLYHPQEIHYKAQAALQNGVLEVNHDWALSPLREAFLQSKAKHLWKPLLANIPKSSNRRELLRKALFACPTLVMNLLAGQGSHTPTSSLIGFSIAIMLGSEPLEGKDRVTEFLDEIGA